ncbi:uncharacterized protein Bfra_008450 [Botrytis fragariae]|uniref:Uncharacterized protein n=1 Tax=Botrytis fragariae TaxID=1964551 RepID=A0A8H6AT75_9HELO|nr:uncharacterized protein Bfra_008450 [Botrytis fragariae]KAF5873172.1 hypothetical protein Bfra_008450 [Botrytis fragariae]
MLFPQLSLTLHDILQRNGTNPADLKAFAYYTQPLVPECQTYGPYSPQCFSPPLDYAAELVAAISCSDGLAPMDMMATEFAEYWRRVGGQSVYLGDR